MRIRRNEQDIELDPAVSEYVAAEGDPCVKEMVSRFVESDGTIDAIFPFKRLAHSVGSGALDPEKEKRSNDVMRGWITMMRERVAAAINDENPKAVKKGGHYLAALNRQLHICDKMDRTIDALMEPIPRHRIAVIPDDLVTKLPEIVDRLTAIEELEFRGFYLHKGRAVVTVTHEPTGDVLELVRLAAEEMGLGHVVIEVKKEN